MAAIYYINYATNEAEAVPNVTTFADMKMKQRGFVEVSAEAWERYIDGHFND